MDVKITTANINRLTSGATIMRVKSSTEFFDIYGYDEDRKEYLGRSYLVNDDGEEREINPCERLTINDLLGDIII